jgi:hypothetical protein
VHQLQGRHSGAIASIAVPTFGETTCDGLAQSGGQLHFASRDENGLCCLWAMDSVLAVDEHAGVAHDQRLADVFRGILGEERTHWWTHEPDAFQRSRSRGPFAGDCTVAILHERLPQHLKVVLTRDGACTFSPCISFASTFDVDIRGYGRFIEASTLYAFEQRCGVDGVGRLVVCCGLEDGTIAMLDVFERAD